MSIAKQLYFHHSICNGSNHIGALKFSVNIELHFTFRTQEVELNYKAQHCGTTMIDAEVDLSDCTKPMFPHKLPEVWLAD
jgi:hypothetical protein